MLASLFVGHVMGQSSIVSFSVLPPNPTTADEITIYAELMFPSSGCVLDYRGHSVVGNTIVASTHHCVGALAAICNTTDTFQIDPLPAGTYTFDLTLSSGAGAPPCTPGIVIDDNDSVSFVVTTSVGIDEISEKPSTFFPNPVLDKLTFHKPTTKPSYLYNLSGKVVLTIDAGIKEIDLSDLNTGTYFLKKDSFYYRVIKL